MKKSLSSFKLPNLSNHNFIIVLFVIICFLISAKLIVAQPVDPKLIELRNRFAIDYLKPEAHFALAKYYLDRGNKVQAFDILEYARRYRFPEKDFDSAYQKFFGEYISEPSPEAKQAFESAYEKLKLNKLDEAEQLFIKAANLAPKSAFIQSWVGRFFTKAKPNNAQALKYYYNAYFQYPHSYDTEYAEYRIAKILSSDADARFDELIKAGKTLPEIANDENPRIVGRAVEKIAKQWKPEYLDSMFKCLDNDDSLVRWFAFVGMFGNEKMRSAELIQRLLSDKDLRKQGLAAYALMEFQKEKGFEVLTKMLTHNAELIRFDAISALVLQGGDKGLEIIKQHRKNEQNILLQQIIDKNLEKNQPTQK